MKAMIMAAGLGTRLKPWTLEHPKALVPVLGVPVLERLIVKLKEEGFDRLVVNVHHFADQVKDFLKANDFGVRIDISDESAELLDTGGALAKACGLLSEDDSPVLVHNVDILDNQDCAELVRRHSLRGNDITLLTSDRESSRKLVFAHDDTLAGWHRVGTSEYRPSGFEPAADMVEQAFSGIYVLGSEALRSIRKYGTSLESRKFPIMDYLLSSPEGIVIRRESNPELRLLDIGKPEALLRASDFV